MTAEFHAEPPSVPEPTDALIEHILARYHETHRRELAELVRLARKVESAHAAHPDVPRGLANLIEQTGHALNEHMFKEEQMLFPMMLAGGGGWLAAPIEVMRYEHVEHGERLELLQRTTHNFVPPEDACDSWRALYAGLDKLVDDIHEHIHLENNVLFPRFSGDSDRQ